MSGLDPVLGGRLAAPAVHPPFRSINGCMRNPVKVNCGNLDATLGLDNMFLPTADLGATETEMPQSNAQKQRMPSTLLLVTCAILPFCPITFHPARRATDFTGVIEQTASFYTLKAFSFSGSWERYVQVFLSTDYPFTYYKED